MKALVFERNLARFAASRMASTFGSGRGVGVGPLRLAEVDEPQLPGPGWHRLRPRLSGICGSDLATLDGRSSRYFEEIVSFPFIPGHEMVADIDPPVGSEAAGSGMGRVVVEPVLSCASRGIDPMCQPCQAGHTGGCERITFGHLQPGLQTGYCCDTGGGWGAVVVAHSSQIHVVPEAMSDEAAVMVEPTACAVHAALRPDITSRDVVVVLGSGTLGLCTIAALRRFTNAATIIATAKYPDQKRLASELGADVVVAPGEISRAVRRLVHTLAVPGTEPTHRPTSRLAGGADVVVDCVGSAASITSALEVIRPRGQVVMVGMPGSVRVDLAPLWHREVSLMGAYAYGREQPGPSGGPAPSPHGPGRIIDGPTRTFDMAFDLVQSAGLERLVSARYALADFTEAIAHAGAAGSRGAVKIVFDLNAGRRRRPTNDPPRRNR
ncbi:MAG: zinc-dependent alcohol dehydrogenase [Acidimicrobiales bacterium]